MPSTHQPAESTCHSVNSPLPAARQKRTLPRRCLDAFAHLLLLLCVATVFLLLQMTTIVFVPFRRQKWVAGAVQFIFRRGLGTLWALWNLLRLIRVSVEGKPFSDGPVVFVANHPSFVDALLLIPHLPRTACLYKAALERSFLPRSLAHNAGFISNAGGVESIREGVERLQAGWRVLLFPEGTRTVTAPMEPWKSSFALMAARAQAPVQPVFIQMSSPLFPKGAPWWKPPEFPVRVQVRFGLSVPPPNEHTARHFHRQVEASFRHELIEYQTASSVPGR